MVHKFTQYVSRIIQLAVAILIDSS